MRTIYSVFLCRYLLFRVCDISKKRRLVSNITIYTTILVVLFYAKL